MKAYEARKCVIIKISKNTINLQHENRRRNFTNFGWIDPGTVFPALGVEALSGLTSTGVQKIIGNDLYLKKGGSVRQIETDGKGLYQGPTKGMGFGTVWNGLYLMKQSGLYDGRGLILGPNSPFKNIPILGMIL